MNGRPEQQPPSTATEVKCRCCPYGFHIDLGFIDFIENVASEYCRYLCEFCSNSLENVVSDFEETLHPRGSTSDRESSIRGLKMRKNDSSTRCNGYLSDYTGAQQISRSLPPKSR
ncbi:unnamed protein product [Gongylonema pulchrum]|uniref:Uncharacterized protein n=1 Tax=Gongylonema pulchrum TaxID=637853 RepID=A0A183D3Q6_9BILA|nr:unnamed protein product [Gongylonema pulchrum]